MSIEAMKLALEALEYIHEGANNQGPHTGISWRCVSKKAEPAITALREALAEQPAQQEPVAWYDAEKDCAYTLADCEGRAQDDLEPLYLAPASKPLTDEQIIEMYNEPRSDAEMLEFARAIEAAHGIKEHT